MKRCQIALALALLVSAPVIQASSYDFDVQTYGGAVCDGVTDDNAAVQKTLNDAVAVLQAEGSPGPVYFPPSPHPSK